jgi:hypothetical protein
MNRVRGARLAGQIRGSGAGPDQHLVEIARQHVDGKRNRRIGQIDDHVDALDLVPVAGDGRPNVDFVLVVRRHYLYLHAELAGVVVDRELRRNH